MWQIIGQTKVVNALERSLMEGHLAHAYLFVGPQHVGKMTMAVNLAQALNCVSDDRPCGQCRSCLRIASGNHPDVQIIQRAETEEAGQSSLRKEIGIGQIREMQHSVNLKPYEGHHRVLIIDGTEYMSEEASNSLLKTLEEPPPSTTFVLLAVDESSFLPTILSRCRRIDFLPMPANEVRQALVERWGVHHERAELLSRLCHGCIGWAISAIDDESLLANRTQNLERLISLADSDISGRFEFAAQLATLFGKNRVLVREQLELWLTWWRDLLLIKNGCDESITNIDRQDALRQQAERYRLSGVAEAIKFIQQTMQQLEQNANPRLAMEVLMLNIPSVEREVNYA